MLPIVLPLALSIACNGKNETTDDSQGGGPDDTGAQPCPGNHPYETYYPDDDADGFGRTDEPLEACQPTPKGYSLREGDCDDTNPDAHPDQQEDCATPFDDDCDGTINQPTGVNLVNCTQFSVDTDADGFGNAGDSACLCEPDKTHTAPAPGDCDDRDPKVHLGTPTCVALVDKIWTARVEGTDIGDYVFAPELDEVAGSEIVIGSPDANGGAGAFFLLPGTSTGTIDLAKKGAPVIEIDGAKGARLGSALAGPARLVGADPQVALEASGGLLVVAAADFGAGSISSPLATITGASVPTVLADDDSDGDSLGQLIAVCETCGVKKEGEVYAIAEPPAGTSVAASIAEATISGTLGGELEKAALADAGDMNADGFEDIAIGAPESAGGPGAAYVFLGPQPKSATLADADAVLSPDKLDLDLGRELAGPADYDDDGYDDLAVGSERHGMNGGVFIMSGPPVSAQSGVDATAIIRGHDGDGLGFSSSAIRTGAGPDAIAIGAPSAMFAAHDAGTVTVLVGPLSGLYYIQTDGVSLVQTEQASAFGSDVTTTSTGDVLVGASDAVFLVPGTAFGL
jgi:hypothetical protein